jgi:hypothetical protein
MKARREGGKSKLRQKERNDEEKRRERKGKETNKGTHMIGPHSREVCCEPLVEPDVLPPGHGDHVAEPGVGQLVTQDVGHLLLSGSWGHAYIM